MTPALQKEIESFDYRKRGAFYKCQVCTEERMYGRIPPPTDYDYKPLIQCMVCGKTTRHDYAGWKP